MILLSVTEIISLHGRLITRTGGTDGVRDRWLLESAVYNTDVSYEEVEKYPTVEEKAARLAYALIQNHTFVDGNKRIGILVMLMTLKLNHMEPVFTQKELIDLGLGIASGAYVYEDILAWIRAHHENSGQSIKPHY